MNGAAAHRIKKEDEVIIMAFQITETDPTKPVNVLVDKKNQFLRYL